LSLSSGNLVSKLAFKCNLHRYTAVGTLRKLVASYLSTPERKVFIMHSADGGGAGGADGGVGLDVKLSLKQALATQLAAGEELALCYSVVG
jgi:hypothetical protein